MNQPLRPMNLGEILDRTFQIYRSRCLVFVGIAALPALVMMGLHLTDFGWLHLYRLNPAVSRTGTAVWNFALSLGYYHISSIIGYSIYPAAVRQCSDAVMNMRTSYVSSLRFVAARWWSYLWVAILKLVAILLAPEALVAGIVFAFGTIADKTNAPIDFPVIFLVIILPVLGGIVCFLWLGASFSLAVPAAALEQLKGVRAMRRSWSLSRESRMRIAIAWVLIFTVALTLGSGFQLLVRAVLFPLYTKMHDFSWRAAYAGSMYGVNAVLSALIGPIYPIAITLFYYDQRIRKEGFDIEHRMQAAGWTSEAAQISRPQPEEEILPEAQA